jgi:hypothetical protein
MAPSAEDLVCTTCGTAVRADAEGGASSPGASSPDAAAHPAAVARLTWTRGTERGIVVWTCDRCSRAHLRSIEAKLDPSWW